MDTITITHTPADGTLATGDTRPHASTLKAHGFRWSRNLGAWFVPNSRDRLPNDWKISTAASALQAVGVAVYMDISHELTSTAEREANRAERLEARRDALTAKAERKATEAERAHAKADRILGMIPMGQPILVGHHSEGRHRRDLDRIDRNLRASWEADAESREAARQVAEGRANELHRYTGPATLRRIEKLEAEARSIARELAEAERVNAAPAYRERLTLRAADVADQLNYWREHLAALEADGWKRWSAADFKPGDYVRTRFGSYKVLRVNKKSLSTETGYSWTQTVPYDEVRGKLAAEDIEAEHAADQLAWDYEASKRN